MTIPPPDVTGQRMTYGPRWATTQAPPPQPTDLRVVGAAWGPEILPDQLTQVLPGQTGYQDLFSTLDPTGAPARAMYTGTYHPPVIGALPRSV